MPAKKEKAYDLIVVGGGPAGSTLATLVKKYAPKRKVLLLERTGGRRHHVGESLLPGLVPVLREMGVYDKIDAAGFPRKLGATYIWGKDREPWVADFNDASVQKMIETAQGAPRIEYAWHVRRSLYDKILLDHAEESGVEVRRDAAAVELVESNGKATGLVVESKGRRVRLSAGMVADCSGQAGFLSKFRKVRQYDPNLKNVAAYAYFKGARWKFQYTGHPDKTKLFLCSVPSGWMWYIPLSADTVSVGLVTTVDFVKRAKIKDLQKLLKKEIAASAEIAPLLKNAEQVADFDGSGQDFFTQSDWSYLNVSAAGDGWIAAGDAAVFVDPILSSGVTLAHMSAHRAAYTLLTAWSKPELAEALKADYNLFCRESATQYLVLATFWYGNDRCAETWWSRAREMQKAWLPVELSDKGAFITVSAGLMRYYDDIFTTQDLQRERLNLPREFPPLFDKHDVPTDSLLKRDSARLLFPYKEETVFLPEKGTGTLRPVKRVRFLKRDENAPVDDVFNPRRVVLRWHLDYLAAIDGSKDLETLHTRAAAKGVPAWWLSGPAKMLLRDLELQGVVRIDKAPSRGQTRPSDFL
jgi:flavin-dependent dehydrogenase